MLKVVWFLLIWNIYRLLWFLIFLLIWCSCFHCWNFLITFCLQAPGIQQNVYHLIIVIHPKNTHKSINNPQKQMHKPSKRTQLRTSLMKSEKNYISNTKHQFIDKRLLKERIDRENNFKMEGKREPTTITNLRNI